jgi:biopolymer transport protein ExbB
LLGRILIKRSEPEIMMMTQTWPTFFRVAALGGILASAGQALAEDSAPWWNKAWSNRQKITIDTGSEAGAASEKLSGDTVLVRLSDQNFQFAAAAEGGADIRFVAADGKTVLPSHIVNYDSMLNNAFAWVKVPELAGSSKTTIYAYYGSKDTAGAEAKKSDAYDADTSLVYHFGTDSTDATSNGNNPANPGASSDGSLVGSGLLLVGGDPVQVPASPSLAWINGQPLTISLWVKSNANQESAVVLSRAEGSNEFRLLLNQGVPTVEVRGGASVRFSATEALAPQTWTHLAVVADGAAIKLYSNGKLVGTQSGSLPALNGPYLIGGDSTNSVANRFAGVLDELWISRVARSESWIKFANVNQGPGDAASRAVSLAQAETGGEGGKGESKLLEHLSLFGDIANNMMFDGWMAIGVCCIMIAVGWTVAVKKFVYLNKVEKSGKAFLELWKKLSSDLTALDHTDKSSVSSFGGIADEGSMKLIKESPLYQIYHIGSEEIRHRLERDKDRTKGLSGRSIQAIKAALDSGLVHELHRLTNGLVFLTISIAGGPYVGLLGTVVGVMITFAIIARSGQVDVNSIAPGIASALLATVVGLVVAIPALFIYSYLNSRIKKITGELQVFIDEFIAKMAEFYPPAGEVSPYAVQSKDQ